ncbi:MAG: class I SAM-dependent methyltransferase [Eubacteriales bacterium]|nr:class I SAM-dependent methyltransferase [Eubacteriales bacterium]
MKETDWDKLLRVRTTGRDDSHADQHCYPYEPTPYSVLERLAGSGMITRKNVLVDLGCGKGRADFFLAWQTGCRCIGVEYDERIFRAAMENHRSCVSASKVTFKNLRAEAYPIPGEADRFYFFNPFSVRILENVLGRILASWYETPREILLFFLLSIR